MSARVHALPPHANVFGGLFLQQTNFNCANALGGVANLFLQRANVSSTCTSLAECHGTGICNCTCTFLARIDAYCNAS